jgi:hypothetical protein
MPFITQYHLSMGENHRRKFGWHYVIRAFFCLAGTYVLLLIPEGAPPPPAGAGKTPWAWNRPEDWKRLEQDFVQARNADNATVRNQVAQLLEESRRLLATIAQDSPVTPEDVRWTALEKNLFALGALVGAKPAGLPEYAMLANAIRREAKEQSAHWDLNAEAARECLYRLLFGGRMGMEEVLIQNPEAAARIPAECDTEPSQTASTMFRGVTLHSGDILVSRGHKPTSALISRGNDYAGSFSHVSLLHVDPATGSACVIHSLIEEGVVVKPLKEYGEDMKLRLMVLRPRANLPAVTADPQAPHKAAAWALKEARARHIPYDFEMDYRDHSTVFCSEVVSAAYEQHGMRLWMAMSHVSSPTIIAWLSGLGVRQFETQEPADLEYDPQLRVVAEWREASALWQAHLDDAVTDVMLANANPGDSLPFSRWKLPLARVAKAYCTVLNWFGRRGKIPEGMSATAALRADKYGVDHHAIKERLTALAAEFSKEHGYSPPYWKLIDLATEARRETKKTE